MSISQLVPLKEAETALLQESLSEGKVIKTGELVCRAFKHFPQLTPSELQRRTPSGTLFWPGRFRYDLDRLKKKGEAINPVKGFWEITSLGIQRLTGSSKPSVQQVQKLSKSERKVMDLIVESVKAIKDGEVPATVIMKEGEFTIKLGEDIKQTKVLITK